jgi:pimeloyl-ACP methyl ester carboxylesterase
VRLALRRRGAGAPLVVLHGLLGSSANWHSIAVRLADRVDVLTLDLRNHGASPHAPAMDYPAMAEDVVEVLDAHGLADAHVLGHSMGGKVAMTLALAAPRRVRRLIVVDIAPVVYPRHDFKPLIDAARALDLGGVASRAEVDRRLAPGVPDDATRALLMQNLVRRGDALAWRIDWEAIAANLPAVIGFPSPLAGQRSEVPALFVNGGASDYVQPEHLAPILAIFPRAEFRTLAGAGHWVHVDAPAALTQLVRDWLP